MRLPEIAARLRILAIDLNCAELNTLAGEMGRRLQRRRAPISSAPISDAIRSRIRAIKEAELYLSQAEIGRRLNVNPGRVSEALRGKKGMII